ncbi:MAG: response regulator [Oligoflexales bacterium]
MEENGNNLNPKSVLVLEDDVPLAGMLTNELRAMGVRSVDRYENGNQAWKACQKKHYDFILMDWKVPALSSLALFNRLKQDSYYRNTPIMVMSGFLDKKDFSLLGEFHNASNIEKPFAVKFLVNKMQMLIKESRWLVQQESRFKTMISELERNQELDEDELLKMINEAPNPVPVAICLGKTLREKAKYDLAEGILLKALKYSDNTVLLSELGKVYLLKGDSEKAKSFLKRANKKSPDNLERLCNLGNLHLKDMDIEEANDAFHRACAIDNENSMAKSGKLLVNNIEKWVTGAISIPETFAGILNSIGVNMVRSGQFSDGIEHYNSALIHVNDQIIKAKLSFNLGLGYLRWNKPQEALDWFQKSKIYCPDFKKAEKYIDNLERDYHEKESFMPNELENEDISEEVMSNLGASFDPDTSELGVGSGPAPLFSREEDIELV